MPRATVGPGQQRSANANVLTGSVSDVSPALRQPSGGAGGGAGAAAAAASMQEYDPRPSLTLPLPSPVQEGVCAVLAPSPSPPTTTLTRNFSATSSPPGRPRSFASRSLGRAPKGLSLTLPGSHGVTTARSSSDTSSNNSGSGGLGRPPRTIGTSRPYSRSLPGRLSFGSGGLRLGIQGPTCKTTHTAQLPCIGARAAAATMRGQRACNEDCMSLVLPACGAPATPDTPGGLSSPLVSASGPAADADIPAAALQWAWVGVFDGHGGQRASFMASRKLHKYVLRHLADIKSVEAQLAKRGNTGILSRVPTPVVVSHNSSSSASKAAADDDMDMDEDDDMGGASAGAGAGAGAVTPPPQEAAIRECFARGYEDMDGYLSQRLWETTRDGAGTTAVAMLVSATHYVISHVGDSRAVLSRAGRAKRLTEDHTPACARERYRLQCAGASLDKHGRLNGLAVSRALGDFDIKQKAVCKTPQPEPSKPPGMFTAASRRSVSHTNLSMTAPASAFAGALSPMPQGLGGATGMEDEDLGGDDDDDDDDDLAVEDDDEEEEEVVGFPASSSSAPAGKPRLSLSVSTPPASSPILDSRLTHRPLVSHPDVTMAPWPSDAEFVVLACDGVWDVMSDQVCVDFVQGELKKRAIAQSTMR